MSDMSFISTQTADGIMRITINRPEKKNALTTDMYNAMSNALDELENNDDLRVGFITGTLDCFTSGNDIVDFMENPPVNNDAPVFRFIQTIATLKKPLVAAVNGPAVGIGTTLLLHCELVYAARSATFQMPFVSMGLCPEAGSSLVLPQIVGYQRAAQLLMLGDKFSAAEAHQWGIVNEVFADEDYQDKAYANTVRLAKQPAKSLRLTKEFLRKANTHTLQDIIAVEGKHFGEMLSGPEAKESMQAFMEKRKPDFTKFK